MSTGVFHYTDSSPLLEKLTDNMELDSWKHLTMLCGNIPTQHGIITENTVHIQLLKNLW